jgi:uncharacterized protein YegL
MKKKLAERGIIRDEDGSMICFVMTVFSAMFLVGGTAVDLARHENLRSSLQYNLDRAVLAAASLKQTQDPTVVVQDYMAKISTIEEFVVEVDSTVAINARSVSATATANLDTWFLSMAGINVMPITARSSSEEKIPNLEISLVLDVSGSMGGSKLANLKVAAKQFVTTLLTETDEDSIAISIVPFNHNVAPPSELFDNLSIAWTHNLSSCLVFSDTDFDSVYIDPLVSQTQAVFTSRYGGFQDFNEGNITCYSGEESEILAYNDSETELHNKIDGLNADGWTAAHLGMKWGLALLDPKFQSVVSSLVTDELVNVRFEGLPVAYSEPQTKKIVVLMGDGANTWEFDFSSAYKGPNSDLWEVVEEEPGDFTHLTYYGRTYTGSWYERYCGGYGITCFYGDPVEVTNHYIDAEGSGSVQKVYDVGSNSWENVTQVEFDALTPGINGVTSKTQLSWEEAWTYMPAAFYDDLTGNNAQSDLDSNGRNGSQADTAMDKSCTAGRDAGIIVYTIGYETNTTTSGKLRDCASTASHYYDASGSQITTVFSAIATSIQKLKLTQ